MPLKPSDILAVNRGGSSGGSSSLSSLLSSSRAKRDAIAQALAQESEYEPSDKSFWDQTKEAVGDTVSAAGRTLDMGRAGLVAGAVEIGDVLRQAAGKETFGSKGGASLDDLRANFNRRIGVGDVLQENTATETLPMNVKRGLAFVGDTAIDPLNLVGGGTSRVARAGLKQVAAEGGEDVAKILARQGEDAANEVLRRQFSEAAAARVPGSTAEKLPSRVVDEVLTPDAVLAPGERFGNMPARIEPAGIGPGPTKAGGLATLDDVGTLPPTPDVPTVRSILGKSGATDEGVEKTLGNISRTGKGGVRFAGKTLIDGDTLAKLPGAQTSKGAIDAIKVSGVGKAVREAIVPYTKTRDQFGEAVASLLPGLGHTRAHYISKHTQVIHDALVNAGVTKLDDATRGQITAALDVGGDVATTRALLADEGLDEAVASLDTMVKARDEAYAELLNAGVDPGDLMAKDEYLRHSLTDEGAEALGIDKEVFRSGSKTKTGAGPSRVREGSITEQNEAFGFDAYKSDPVELVRASADHAYTVGGNKLLFESLDDIARKTGQKVTSKVPKEGFTKIAPNAYIDDTIFNDLLNLRKAGADNTIVRGWDAFTGILKRYTLFGPIAFGPYFTQNMATGVAMNAARFGVRPQDYAANLRYLQAIKKAEGTAVAGFLKGGDSQFDIALRAALPDPEEYRIAKAMWDNGLVDPGKGTYDDLASAAKGSLDDTKFAKRTRMGTNTTVRINAFGEEMLRGSAFVKSLRDGMDPDTAAQLVRDTHLDYSALGKTAFERNAINRFVFFPTWLLRAPKQIVSAYAQKPGLAMAQMRLEQGTHWYDRERNDYGDPLGARISGPMSFLTGLGQGQLPVDGSELMNPLARAVVDQDARTLQDIIPPASQWTRGAKVVNDEPNARGRYAASMLGVRTGVDYGGERAVEDLQNRIAEREQLGGEATPSQTLAMRAIDILGPEAAGMSTKELVIRLVQDEGVPADDIRRILSAPYKSVERQPLSKLPASELDAMLESGMNPNDIRDLLVNG